MNKITNKVLTAVMISSAVLLGIGNLMIVKSLQPQNFNMAILHLVCGIAVALAVYFCETKRLLKAAPYLIGIELILLLICPVFGYNINGATRWLAIGSFRFAPALQAMPILCLFWAYVKDKAANGISKKNVFLLSTVTLLTTGLILIEPFYSMAGFIAILGLILLALVQCSWKKAAITAAVVLIAGAALVPVMQKNFCSNLFTPDYNTQYHTWSLFTTLKHSVFCGRHQVPAEPKYHIPYAVTDSALIAGCGEFGYLFLIVALLLAASIIACGVIITNRKGTPSDRLLAGGMTAVIALPALVNILMMFSLLPMGGVAFPFLAYGGTAMLANAFALGCIITFQFEPTKDQEQ